MFACASSTGLGRTMPGSPPLSKTSFEMKDLDEALPSTAGEEDLASTAGRRGKDDWTMYRIRSFRPNTGVLLIGRIKRIPVSALTAEQQDWVRLWV